MYVGTVHPFHLKTVLMMIEAGKPVLCEKPLTCSAADTQTLIKAARDKGVFLMEVRGGEMMLSVCVCVCVCVCVSTYQS